jgi:hypothetical protein
MQQMAERDIQLNNLGERTERFASTSAMFANSSKQLHYKMLLRRYFTGFVVSVIILDFIIFIVAPDSFYVATGFLLAILAAGYFGFQMYQR